MAAKEDKWDKWAKTKAVQSDANRREGIEEESPDAARWTPEDPKDQGDPKKQ